MMTIARPPAVPSLRAVARACGVSQTAVYRHFTSQSDLIQGVLSAHLDDLEGKLLTTYLADQPPRERFRDFAAEYAMWAVEHIGAYRLLFESTEDLPEAAIVAERSTQVIAHMAALTAALRPDDAEPDVFAQRVWVCLHGLSILRGHKPTYMWRVPLREEAVAIIDSLFPEPIEPSLRR